MVVRVNLTLTIQVFLETNPATEEPSESQTADIIKGIYAKAGFVLDL